MDKYGGTASVKSGCYEMIDKIKTEEYMLAPGLHC